MNFRPWYKRLVRNPFSFLLDLYHFAYVQSTSINPTLQFGKRVISSELEFDTGKGELNGIPFGVAIDRLRPLGVAEIALSTNGEPEFSLEYSSLGLALTFDAHGLVSFEISFDSIYGEHPIKFIPCKRASVKLSSGQVFELTYSSSPTDLNGILGSPAEIEEAEYAYGVESVAVYYLPACRIIASFDKRDNKLIHLDLSRPKAPNNQFESPLGGWDSSAAAAPQHGR